MNREMGSRDGRQALIPLSHLWARMQPVTYNDAKSTVMRIYSLSSPVCIYALISVEENL